MPPTLRAARVTTRPWIAAVAASVALCTVACGGSGPGAAEPNEDPFDPLVLYPLALGNVWSYNIDTGTDMATLAITRVIAVVGRRIEVSSGGDPAVYDLRPEGIYQPGTETWLLRRPIRAGAEWPSTGGRTARVASVSAAVETPAGAFTGCVRIEESGGETGQTIRTVYCPNVGPVLVESVTQLELARTPVRVIGRLLGFQLAED